MALAGCDAADAISVTVVLIHIPFESREQQAHHLLPHIFLARKDIFVDNNNRYYATVNALLQATFGAMTSGFQQLSLRSPFSNLHRHAQGFQLATSQTLSPHMVTDVFSGYRELGSVSATSSSSQDSNPIFSYAAMPGLSPHSDTIPNLDVLGHEADLQSFIRRVCSPNNLDPNKVFVLVFLDKETTLDQTGTGVDSTSYSDHSPIFSTMQSSSSGVYLHTASRSEDLIQSGSGHILETSSMLRSENTLIPELLSLRSNTSSTNMVQEILSQAAIDLNLEQIAYRNGHRLSGVYNAYVSYSALYDVLVYVGFDHQTLSNVRPNMKRRKSFLMPVVNLSACEGEVSLEDVCKHFRWTLSNFSKLHQGFTWAKQCARRNPVKIFTGHKDDWPMSWKAWRGILFLFGPSGTCLTRPYSRPDSESLSDDEACAASLTATMLTQHQKEVNALFNEI